MRVERGTVSLRHRRKSLLFLTGLRLRIFTFSFLQKKLDR